MDTSIISFSASSPPHLFNPAPHCFSDISLSKTVLPADVDFSFSATVFLSTSKAAGIKLALFSTTQHQRHLTDAEEQRFRLDIGRKLSNAPSTEIGGEASGGRLDPPSPQCCAAAAGLSTPSVPCPYCQFPVGDSPTISEKQTGISCGVRSCGWTVACTESITPASIAPSLAAPPSSLEHRQQHTNTSISMPKQTPPHPPGLLAPIASGKGEGGNAKCDGKRLGENREQQAEDLGPDPIPSPEFTLPLMAFAWLFSSPAASPTCWVQMQTEPLALPLPLMTVTRLQPGAILRELQLVAFPVAAGDVRFFRCSNGKLSNKPIPSGDTLRSLVFAHPFPSEHVAPPRI